MLARDFLRAVVWTCAISPAFVCRASAAEPEPAVPDAAGGAMELRCHHLGGLLEPDEEVARPTWIHSRFRFESVAIPICPQSIGCASLSTPLFRRGDAPTVFTGRFGAQVEVEWLAESIEGMFPLREGSSPLRFELRGHDLLVVGDAARQARVAGLLHRLEAARAPRIAVDLALVPLEALALLQEVEAEARGSPWLPEDAIDRAVRTGGRSAVLLSALLRDGDWKQLRPSSSTIIAQDREVDGTHAEPMAGPVFEPLLAGAFADLRAWLLPGGRLVRVDLHLERTEPLGLESRKLARGTIDLPAWREEGVASTWIIPVGVTAVVARCRVPELSAADAAGDKKPEASGPRSFATLIRVRIEDLCVPPGSTGPALLAIGGLVEPVPDASLVEGSTTPPWDTAQVDPVQDDDPPPLQLVGGEPVPAEDRRLHRSTLVDSARLRSTLEGVVDSDSVPEATSHWMPYGPWLVLEAPEACIRRAEARLAETLRLVSRQVAVDVWAFRVGVREAARLAVRKDALEPKELEAWARDTGAAARVLLTDGTTAAIVSASARRYLSDVNKISGGNEQRIVVEWDPELSSAGEGFALNATARVLPEGGRIRLRLRGDLSRGALAWRRREAVVNEHRGATEGEARVGIDLPETVSYLFTEEIDLPGGMPVLLEVVPDAEAPGWCRALAARATAVPGT